MIWTDYVMKLQPWKVHLFFVSIDFPQKYIKMFQQYYTCFNSLDIKQNYFRKRLFFFSPLCYVTFQSGCNIIKNKIEEKFVKIFYQICQKIRQIIRLNNSQKFAQTIPSKKKSSKKFAKQLHQKEQRTNGSLDFFFTVTLTAQN